MAGKILDETGLSAYSKQVKSYINTQVSKATNITGLFNYSAGTIDTRSNNFKTNLLSSTHLSIDTNVHNGGAVIAFDREPGDNDTYIDFSPNGESQIGVSTSDKIYIVNDGYRLTLPTDNGTIALTSDIPQINSLVQCAFSASSVAYAFRLQFYSSMKSIPSGATVGSIMKVIFQNSKRKTIPVQGLYISNGVSYLLTHISCTNNTSPSEYNCNLYYLQLDTASIRSGSIGLSASWNLSINVEFNLLSDLDTAF